MEAAHRRPSWICNFLNESVILQGAYVLKKQDHTTMTEIQTIEGGWKMSPHYRGPHKKYEILVLNTREGGDINIIKQLGRDGVHMCT